MSRDWQCYLNDILEACQRARSYSAGLDLIVTRRKWQVDSR